MSKAQADQTNKRKQPTLPLHLLLFQLHPAQTLYALPTEMVREIAHWQPWTLVPGTSPLLGGIISQRGVVIPVLDIRVLWNIPQDTPSNKARYIIVSHEDNTFAILAEPVLDLHTFAGHSIQPADTIHPPSKARYLAGVITHPSGSISLVDLAMIIDTFRATAFRHL